MLRHGCCIVQIMTYCDCLLSHAVCNIRLKASGLRGREYAGQACVCVLPVREGDLLDELISRIIEEGRYTEVRKKYKLRVGNPFGKTRAEMLVVLGTLDKKQQQEDLSPAAEQDDRTG